jgi:ornithine cyclodeaminase/alanine dehydrogenase-like protein (mu-crystallin family)
VGKQSGEIDSNEPTRREPERRGDPDHAAHRAGGGRVRLLSRSDVEQLLDLPACIAAVQHAFRLRAEGAPLQSGILGLHVPGGGFHAKAATMPARAPGGVSWFAAKLNANFPNNPTRNALPTIQGILVLFDASCGAPLAVMDSIALTILRTAAATAVAARYLAKPDARTVTIVGCGAQALTQLRALAVVRPLTRVFAHDLDTARARAFAHEAANRLGIPVEAVDDLSAATLASDIIVTCTSARRPFLGTRHVAPGAFVAAVGADNEEKSEIEPALMTEAAVVADSADQCAAIGDLHHALDAGAMHLQDVRGELGDVILDATRGRRDPREIVIFDSTGVAIQDVAAAALVHERAEREQIGSLVDLGV